MSNVKFFIVALIVLVVIVFAIAFALSSEDVLGPGILAAVLVSVFITLFRILKKGNNPDNWLGGWKYFFALFIFVTGILTVGLLAVSQDEETIPVSILVGFVIASVMSLIRGIKHRGREKKAEKERNQQYQEQLQRKNQQYADEIEKKDRIINDLRSRNSELQNSRQSAYSGSSYSSSSSRYQDLYQEEQMDRQREQMRRQEEEDRKRERLDDWYRDYVTIDVDFEYHVVDSEYNQDYWESRSEEIRVSRREAMALIEAGDSAIFGKLGYANWSKIRNFRYKVPYGLYDRPMGC